MTALILKMPTPPPPKPPSKELPDREAVAASHCPACGEALRFVRCEGVCRSTKCIYRLVLTCSDA